MKRSVAELNFQSNLSNRPTSKPYKYFVIKVFCYQDDLLTALVKRCWEYFLNFFEGDEVSCSKFKLLRGSWRLNPLKSMEIFIVEENRTRN